MSQELNRIDVEQIMELLPHRYPFLLVDRVLDYTPGERLHAIKNVTMNEPFFTGHFPQKPVFPGVLMIEALAQATGVLSAVSLTEEEKAKESLYFFASIDNAKFKKVVVPGDTLHLKVELLKIRRGMGRFSCVAEVDGEEVCSAEVMCARREV